MLTSTSDDVVCRRPSSQISSVRQNQSTNCSCFLFPLPFQTLKSSEKALIFPSKTLKSTHLPPKCPVPPPSQIPIPPPPPSHGVFPATLLEIGVLDVSFQLSGRRIRRRMCVFRFRWPLSLSRWMERIDHMSRED
uniref:Uncharacterized protein n=1 Tax=Kalanchoe fedtschenkoi TaxID=63787 RepID=A0A7N0T145_KALFE